MSDTEQRVIKVIAEQASLEESQITMETTFKEDLRYDDLDFSEIHVLLKEEFGIEISEQAMAGFKNVYEIVDYVTNLKSQVQAETLPNKPFSIQVA